MLETCKVCRMVTSRVWKMYHSRHVGKRENELLEMFRNPLPLRKILRQEVDTAEAAEAEVARSTYWKIIIVSGM